MSDYIASSRKISNALNEQGITVEVDEFAPYIFKAHEADQYEVASWMNGRAFIGRTFRDWFFPVCPYFGPGGADNSHKALFALGYSVWVYEGARGRPCVSIKKNLLSEEDPYVLCADTAGIALAALLYKLMEVK